MASYIGRREFLATLGGAAVAWPLAARAQERMRRIAMLVGATVAPAMMISLISLAYVEEDGLVLSVSLLAAIILIGIGSAAVWGTIVGAVLISGW